MLDRYDEALLRRVAARLVKPRGQWPVEELVERAVATLTNAPVVDRRLGGLAPAGRKLLALVSHSRQPRWALGHLVELTTALGHAEGVGPVLELLEEGLLCPVLPEGVGRLKSFEQWVGQAQGAGHAVFAHPAVTARALGEDLGLPECPGQVAEAGPAREADGLEWPLRLAVLWQRVAAEPLRQTQQGDFFKRDWDRLRSDPLLTGPPAESVGDVADPGLLAVELARCAGVLIPAEGELRAGELPTAWADGLPAALEHLWAAVPCLERWNAAEGWRGQAETGNPYPPAYLLALLLLARLPGSGWARPAAVESWVRTHHPYWAEGGATATSPGVAAFLLGLAFQLGLVQAAPAGKAGDVVRLSPTGRWLLGLAPAPPATPDYPKTLTVQPTLEVVAYRQGLTPALVAALSRMAAWKGLGAACTLQLQPDTVYRALETGDTFEAMLHVLEQHGMRPTPPAVVESLRTWAHKRERLSVYPSAALFEFASAADLDQALARGLPGVRVAERLAVVPNEGQIDYRHFRLTGTRDYALPPDRCVEVEPDGVTLTVDPVRADLLLETELRRFAELLERSNGRLQYRLTPASVRAGRDSGFAGKALEDWFVQRTGQPVTPAVRLFVDGAAAGPLVVKRQVVVHVGSAEVADGLMQWPGTRALVAERLGPTALVVAEEDLARLRQTLGALGMELGE